MENHANRCSCKFKPHKGESNSIAEYGKSLEALHESKKSRASVIAAKSQRQDEDECARKEADESHLAKEYAQSMFDWGKIILIHTNTMQKFLELRLWQEGAGDAVLDRAGGARREPERGGTTLALVSREWAVARGRERAAWGGVARVAGGRRSAKQEPARAGLAPVGAGGGAEKGAGSGRVLLQWDEEGGRSKKVSMGG
ncbi:hypothetical protein C2845_PM14G09660 [Panicum miliaceum]|uniref:Uncharacterized protein n=1 Tax=Panicum miliaceum TaxID=4540 RepID=A0A3L6PKX1_PANMI|nr:hypothetical protein C2845_PM14G09660 [Panicum miliaceum]